MISASCYSFSNGSFHELETYLGRVLPSRVVRGRKNPLHKAFSHRLRQRRNGTGKTLAEVAAGAGLAGNSVVLYLESGERTPRLDTVERIAYALGLSPAFLAYGLEGDAKPPAKGLRCEGVAQRLADARTARGLSVLAVAKLAGLSHTAVGNVERGTMPTLATAEALAKALDLSPAWLAFGVGDKEAQRTRRRPRADGAAATR